MNKHLVSAFFLLAATMVWGAQNPSEPIKIDPSVSKLSELLSTKTGKKFFIGTVVNASESGDSAIVGYTRISRKNKAPIVCDPTPSLIAKRSLMDIFADRKINTNDPSSANFMVDVTILEFKIIEESKFLHQIMKSVVRLDVKVTDPYDASKFHKFRIESAGEQTAFDTTKYAQGVMKQALESAIVELLKSLDGL